MNKEKIAERQMALSKKGLYSLKGWKFNREELYERVAGRKNQKIISKEAIDIMKKGLIWEK